MALKEATLCETKFKIEALENEIKNAHCFFCKAVQTYNKHTKETSKALEQIHSLHEQLEKSIEGRN